MFRKRRSGINAARRSWEASTFLEWRSAAMNELGGPRLCLGGQAQRVERTTRQEVFGARRAGEPLRLGEDDTAALQSEKFLPLVVSSARQIHLYFPSFSATNHGWIAFKAIRFNPVPRVELIT